MICETKYCRGKKAPRSKKCYACQKKVWREKNPIKNAYNNLKTNAKRRGKPFNLTLQEFEFFCIETKYNLGSGKQKDSLHIDRIDEGKGYQIDNIQVLTNTDNVRKYLDYRYNGENMDFTTRTIKDSVIKDSPF